MDLASQRAVRLTGQSTGVDEGYPAPGPRHTPTRKPAGEGGEVPNAPLPYRGTFGHPRPAALRGLSLPPAPMPSHLGSRPLKAWRYLGLFGAELMVCLAAVRVGPARQAFWAVWDRRE